MLLADEGKTQQEICQILGCAATTTNRWIFLHGLNLLISGKTLHQADQKKSQINIPNGYRNYFSLALVTMVTHCSVGQQAGLININEVDRWFGVSRRCHRPLLGFQALFLF
jgi:hypothetical protein